MDKTIKYKRILILANNDLGLYNFRKELLERLLNDGNEVYISLPYGPKIEEMCKLGCKFIETNVDRRGTNVIKDINLFFQYIRIVKKIKPDVILTYTIKPNIYGGIVSRLTKTVYIENITGLGTALENKGMIQKVTILLYKVALKEAKCCFVQNTENLKFMMEKIGYNEKYKLIPGSGVNLKKFKVLEYPKEDDKIRFFFISRIMKEKGIEQYLETAKYIVNKYPNTEFHILGFCEQNYEEILKELEEKNIIIYHGRKDNIIPFLKESSCTIHPSYYPEGMSNVLLESAASGRPVITTDRSGCRETVDNEKTGYIIEERDTKELENMVEKFIKLPYEDKVKMGVLARKKMEKEFDREIVIQAYVSQIHG